MSEKILLKIIEKLGKDVSAETLVSELGIDSLDLMTYIFEIEEEFGIEIDQDRLTEINSVGDLISAVEAKL